MHFNTEVNCSVKFVGNFSNYIRICGLLENNTRENVGACGVIRAYFLHSAILKGAISFMLKYPWFDASIIFSHRYCIVNRNVLNVFKAGILNERDRIHCHIAIIWGCMISKKEDYSKANECLRINKCLSER